MKTSILPTTDSQALLQAADLLSKGEVVAIPTETVYGLAALATDESAIGKIFAAKNRPADNPLIVHIASFQQLYGLVKEISLEGQKLINAFWPGPLTIILPVADDVPKVVTAGLNTLAVRMPLGSFLHKLIDSVGPLAAPSANLSGKPSPVTAEDVYQDLNTVIPLILDGGPCQVGIESTIVDLSVFPPALLRPGGITAEQIKQHVPDLVVPDSPTADTPSPAKAPGMKYTHYSPTTPLHVYSSPEAAETAFQDAKQQNKQVQFITFQTPANPAEDILDLSNPQVAAQKLFSALREADKSSLDLVISYLPPQHGLFASVRNRLEKAAHELL